MSEFERIKDLFSELRACDLINAFALSNITRRLPLLVIRGAFNKESPNTWHKGA